MTRKSRAFLSNRSGNFAAITAVCLTFLALAVGVAVDFSSSQSDKKFTQSAMDSAVLAAVAEYARSGNKQAAFKAGANYFAANMETASHIATTTPSFSIDATGAIVGSANVTTPTSFMKLARIENVKFPVTATAAVGVQDVEVALVLDVSSSMMQDLGGKVVLDEMKGAAKQLLSTLTSSPGVRNLKAAVIPFAQTVNIGTSMSSVVTGADNPLFASDSWDGCVFERAPPYHNADVYNGSNTQTQGKWHAYIAPPEPNAHVQTAEPRYCVNPSNGTNSGYGPQTDWLKPAMRKWGWDIDGKDSVWREGPNFNCTQHPIMPLTSNIAAINQKIDSLTAPSNLGTIIAPGIAWGRRVLSPQEPFSQGAPANSRAKRIMIVLTDGEQRTNGDSWEPLSQCYRFPHSGGAFEFDPAKFKLGGNKLGPTGPHSVITPYGYILDSNPFGTGNGTFASEDSDLDRLTRDACKEAKDSSDKMNIEVFTIGITKETAPGTRIHSLMQDCASSKENFYYVNAPGSLKKVFDNIAEKIGTIYLSN